MRELGESFRPSSSVEEFQFQMSNLQRVALMDGYCLADFISIEESRKLAIREINRNRGTGAEHISPGFLRRLRMATSFGGTNIDPTMLDKKCAGETRFSTQVKVVTRKICKPPEEDSSLRKL
ncbi:DCD domain-containing protein NRP-A [Linum perenne]